MRFVIPGAAEDLCLAYANTLAWRGRPTPVEALAGWADLLLWLERNAGWPGPAIAALCAGADATAMYPAALALREAIFAIFRAIADGRPVADPDLSALDRAVAAAPGRTHVARRDGGFGWQLEVTPERLSAPVLLAPVLWSAADLVAAAARHDRVRRCANDECLWLFVDQSKSGSRRWCDMAACGNRAKARRHYLKVSGGR